ncbi:MAG: NosD domain-containing protein [Halobacteriales archaeon]|nr:NosD domain-containing protein [Halobacteriales archaeon]
MGTNVGRLLYVTATVLALLVVVGVFVVSPGTTPEPVDFDDTVRLGMSDADIRQAEFGGYEIPRAQVFYSQYGFVVGYNGVDSFARNLQESRYERVWGVPTKAYVTDFSGTEPLPAEDGLVETSTSPDWTDAEEAVYVVTSDAVVPFSSVEDAETYADEHGGDVLDFDELLETEFAAPDVLEVADAVVEERAEEADAQAKYALELLDRELSVTVGGNSTVETVQDAVDAAPPNTSVRVPEGVYEENVVLDKPVTLVGEEGTHIVGDGNGTVVSVESDDAAVSSLSISGVGNRTRGEPGQNAGWDESVERAFGHSDAGVLFNSTSRGLVHDVEIDTPATGVLFFDTEGGVVSETTVRGTEEWIDGFMGVLSIRSPAVVQNSSLHGGRDSVYSHASNGLVVRDSYMEGGRFGVHLMYTSDTLLSGNSIRDKELAGIIVMTRPTGNYVVGNDIRRSRNGLSTVGTESYFAENVVVENRYGIRMGARSSVYTRNEIVRNSLGARASSIIPSNNVVENDFVDNDVQVTAAEGSMRLWGHEGVGNYWSNAPPDVDEFRPTDPIDSSVTTVDGMVTVRESPSYSLMRSLETVVPGTFSSGIVDEHPLSEPVAYDERTEQTVETTGASASDDGTKKETKQE